MKYVIDAFNLIFAHPKLEEALENHGFQAARQMLVGMLTRFAHADGAEEIVAIFDGSEKAAHRPRRQVEAAGKILLIYAMSPENADHAVIEYVDGAARPGEITVVSSDKFIIRNVRGSGAHHVGARGFIRRMTASLERAADPMRGEDPRKYHGSLSPREVEEWMRIMGFEEPATPPPPPVRASLLRPAPSPHKTSAKHATPPKPSGQPKPAPTSKQSTPPKPAARPHPRKHR